MTSRWKFGQVEFKINPSSASNTVSQVGDNARTLGGTVVSQPTGFIERYNITGRVYQPNVRVLKEISMPNAQFIKYYKSNDRVYVLNAISSRIEEYDRNFNKIKDIPISTQAYVGYVGFDVYRDNFYVFSKVSTTEEMIYKLSLTGTLISGISNTGVSGTPLGYTFVGDYLWRNSGSKIDKLDYFNSNLTPITHVHPPSLAGVSSPNGYVGATALEDRFIVTALNKEDERIVFYMDSLNASIASVSYIDEAHFIHDIEVIDGRLMLLNRTNHSIQIVNSNTALLDLHRLEREIQEYGYIYLEDDMGFQTRVTIVEYSKERVQGYEHMYTISMGAQTTSGGGL